MGAYITLGIKKMEIDLEKNYNYTNHSRLFQEKDFDKDIPYYYVDNDDNEIEIIYTNIENIRSNILQLLSKGDKMQKNEQRKRDDK